MSDPHQANTSPQSGEPTPNVWPNYGLPPDLVTGLPPHPPLGAPRPGPPTASTRPQPLLVVAAGVLALVVGVAGTLLITQPWASSEGTGTGTTQAAPASTYAAPTTSNPLQLAAAEPGAALTQQAADDRSTITEIPDGYWVPQLSSKRVGLVADGITYTEQDIWEDRSGLRSANPGAALLWSGDYTTFKYPDFWVTIMPSAYSSTAGDANQWCASRGFDGDHCYAKRISATSYYDQTTEHR